MTNLGNLDGKSFPAVLKVKHADTSQRERAAGMAGGHSEK